VIFGAIPKALGVILVQRPATSILVLIVVVRRSPATAAIAGYVIAVVVSIGEAETPLESISPRHAASFQ